MGKYRKITTGMQILLLSDKVKSFAMKTIPRANYILSIRPTWVTLVVNYVLDNRRAVVAASRLLDITGCSLFKSQPLISVIQGWRRQVERREGYELQLVMAMVMGCQWDGAT